MPFEELGIEPAHVLINASHNHHTQGQVANDPVPDRGAFPESKAKLGRSPIGWLRAPWEVTMRPDRLGGRGHRLGVLPLALLPCLLFVRRFRGRGTTLAVVGLWMIGWLMLRQNVRFLLPIVPVLCVPVAWVLVELLRITPLARVLAVAAVALAVAMMTAAPVWRLRDRAGVIVGLESPADYIARHDFTFQAAETLNRMTAGKTRPDAVRLLSEDYRAFRFNAIVVRENVYRRRTSYHEAVAVGDTSLWLEMRAGRFTHLFLVDRPNGEVEHAGVLSALVDAEVSRRGAESMFVVLIEYTHMTEEGEVRCRLVEVP